MTNCSYFDIRLIRSYWGDIEMLQITRRCDYAIRGMVYLASKPPNKVSMLNDIASATEVSQTFLAKIFQHFKRIGLVKSYRGAGGGFQLGRPADEITLLDIVEAVEGPIEPNRCIMAEGLCSRELICTVHPIWKEVQKKLKTVLRGVTLKHLAGE